MRKPASPKPNGMIAIMFSIFVVVALTLLAVAFAALSRDDQRQTLDRNLSMQAKYAAETQINRLRKSIIANGGNITSDNACNDNDNIYIDVKANIKVTCALVEPGPKKLTYQKIGGDGGAKSFYITNTNATASKMKITWQSSDDGHNGLLDYLDPMSIPANLSPYLRLVMATNLAGNNMSRNYLAPVAAGASLPEVGDPTVGGYTRPAECSSTTPRTCSSTMSLPSAGAGVKLWFNLTSLNTPADVTIEFLDSAYNPVSIEGVQAIIDVTARAQDVVQRLRVTIPLQESAWQPAAVVASSGNICKNFQYDGSASTMPDPGFSCDPVSQPRGGLNPNGLQPPAGNN